MSDEFRLTPLDVRKTEFKKTMRGYEPLEVEDFRARVADEHERLVKEKILLEDSAIGTAEPGRDVIALHDALDALATIDPRKSRVVELRYFGGLTAEETAEVLGISAETVHRDWKMARVWLVRELGGGGATPAGQ